MACTVVPIIMFHDLIFSLLHVYIVSMRGYLCWCDRKVHFYTWKSQYPLAGATFRDLSSLLHASLAHSTTHQHPSSSFNCRCFRSILQQDIHNKVILHYYTLSLLLNSSNKEVQPTSTKQYTVLFTPSFILPLFLYYRVVAMVRK